MIAKLKPSLRKNLAKSLVSSAIPLCLLTSAYAQSEGTPQDPDYGKVVNSEDAPSPVHKNRTFRRYSGVKTETTIVRHKEDFFNCVKEECLFSVWAGPKYVFTTGNLRSTYGQASIALATVGAEKPFHRFGQRSYFTFGATLDYFGYTSKALGTNQNSASTDHSSNYDGLYGYTNITPYFGMEHFDNDNLSYFVNLGPQLQYRSFVVQNSVTTQPLDYIISTTLGISAEIGARLIMPITEGFNFFLRPAANLNLGPAVTKNLVFQSTAGQPESVSINPFTYAASISVGGEF